MTGLLAMPRESSFEKDCDDSKGILLVYLFLLKRISLQAAA